MIISFLLSLLVTTATSIDTTPFQANPTFLSPKPPKPLEFLHGTTTLSFLVRNADTTSRGDVGDDVGILLAVDSRASQGSYVASSTVNKVLPISDHHLATMAGGAADCSYWIRSVRSEVMRKKLAITDPNRGPRTPPTTRMISKMLASNLYNLSKKGLDLSVGTMVVGWDKEEGSNIWMVDDKGKRLSGKVFSLGSGSTYALGVLDDCLRAKRENEDDVPTMTVAEACEIGKKAIKAATFRDGYSGGYINVYYVDRKGWRKLFSEDLHSGEEI